MTTYLELNAQTNLYDDEGRMQLDKDKEAAKAYFLEHVNPNTVFFHDLEEKVGYMTAHGYWDTKVLDLYSFQQIKDLFKLAYSYKYRFQSFVGAYKFYTSYACKTYDGDRYLERFEDRVCLVALAVARGDWVAAQEYVKLIMTGKFQPATPTFLNAGRGDAGDLVSCFLLRLEDNMESIGRAINSSLQLSKRGGGVALLLTNLREANAPIKNVQGAASGVVPVMKILEDSFSYADQLGARQGAGAVYLNAHHPDIMAFLDTKRENADEKVRIKTLSLGVVVPDVTFQLARENKPMYLFSPYDVERVYGKPFSDISVTEHYDEMVEDPRIRKTKINAREFFQTLAEVQFESGYPYLVFEDTANRANPIAGRINMSNLCSEILQVNTPSEYAENLYYSEIGQDISCNLGSLNVANAMADVPNLDKTVYWAIHFLTQVSKLSDAECVPSVKRGNEVSRSVGLGQMNLHGYLASQGIAYGSPEALDFTNVYFAYIKHYALQASNQLARQAGTTFEGYLDSDYPSGKALAAYTGGEMDCEPKFDQVSELFRGLPRLTVGLWRNLQECINAWGLYNAYLTAVPPTGNISYVNGATSSIHPVTSPVEIRKEGKMGRVYYPAPGLTEDNLHLFKDAYELGYEAVIDTYAEATKHTDQGLSLTLFFKDSATTRDINKAQIYAWRKGIKTLYYIRLRQAALEGTQVDSCVSCTL